MEPSQLEQLLKFLNETLVQSKDFTLEQAPLFVRELLTWKFYSAAVWMATLSTLVPVLAVTTYKCLADAFHDADRKSFRAFVTGLAVFVVAIVVAVNSYTMVKIKVAPRVVLVEMVRDLITPNRH